MVKDREKIEWADQSETRPNKENQRKSWETGIGQHPLNGALGGRCGDETGRVVEKCDERAAVGI
jgi:hypothetical protein